jgi:hypothetical protein
MIGAFELEQTEVDIDIKPDSNPSPTHARISDGRQFFMLARVFSCTVVGLDGVIVDIEVDIRRGLPGITIVGLPDIAV